MATKVACSVDMFVSDSSVFNPPIQDVAILDIRMRTRYQLSLSINGVNPVVDDVLSPEFQYFFEIPLSVLALPGYREEYLLVMLSSLHLDASEIESLAQQILTVAVNMAEHNSVHGFMIVANVVVSKFEVVGGEEVGRISPELMEMDGGDLLQSFASIGVEWLKDEDFDGRQDVGAGDEKGFWAETKSSA